MLQGQLLRPASRAGALGPGCAPGSATPRVPLQAALSGPRAPRLPGSCLLPAMPRAQRRRLHPASLQVWHRAAVPVSHSD